nr:G protein-coupled receptor [Proales similis]
MNFTASLSSDLQLIISIGQWMGWISFYFTVVLVPTGILLNLANLFVFSRARLNKTNMGFLYLIQTAVDLVLLFYTLFVIGSNTVFGVEFEHLSDMMCRLVTFGRQVTIHASAWMTVLITLDRFLFIQSSKRVQFLKRKKNWAVIMGVVLAAIAAVNLPNFAYHIQITYSHSGGTRVERKTCQSDSTFSTVNSVITVLVRTYIPIAVMAILNFNLICFISRAKARVRQNSTTVESKSENSFVRVVVAQNLLYLAINGPLSVGYMVLNFRQFGWINLGRVPAMVFNFIFLCFVLLSYFYQIFSFFWHFLLNKLFREEVLCLTRVKDDQLLSQSTNTRT